MRILITGFGPFPGAPFNPTARIARRLAALRRPALAGVERLVAILPTTYAALSQLPALIADSKADLVLMFGLAGRRRQVTPERRGINYVSTLRKDAAGQTPNRRALVATAPAQRLSPLNVPALAATMRRSGAMAAVSNDAGDYLCNAGLFTALGCGVPALFVHVPRARRSGRPKTAQKRPRPSRAQIDKAAEAAMFAMLRLGRNRTTSQARPALPPRPAV